MISKVGEVGHTLQGADGKKETCASLSGAGNSESIPFALLLNFTDGLQLCTLRQRQKGRVEKEHWTSTLH